MRRTFYLFGHKLRVTASWAWFKTSKQVGLGVYFWKTPRSFDIEVAILCLYLSFDVAL